MPDPVGKAAGTSGARPRVAAVLPLALCALLCSCAGQAPRGAAGRAAVNAVPAERAYPATRRVEQRDSYHGVLVDDPWRWLEALDSTEVHDWVEAENAVATPYLDRLPARAAFKQRLTERWRNNLFHL